MKFAACLLICGFLLCAGESVEKTFETAVRALEARNYEAAEQGFNAVLKQQPRNIGALGNLGIIYSRTNRADKAITVYRRALRLSPDDKAILLNLGLVYLKQEVHAKALPLFKRVAALDPEHLQARQLLALCRLYTGDVAPAIKDLEALRAANPRDTQILFLLGFAYLKDKQPDAAKAVFQDMFAAAGPAQTQFMLARAYYEAGMFAPAEESFQEVLRRDPGFPGIHMALAKVFISEHRTEPAKRELELILKENPDDADALYLLGGMLVQQEARFEEAIPYLERSLKGKGDFWAPYFYLGKAKLGLDQPAEAVTLLQRAVELNPDDATAFYLLARALQACGRTEEAKASLSRVRELETAGPPETRLAGKDVAGTR